MTKLTAEQRLALVVEVYDWLVKHTETWEVGYGDRFWDSLGAEIAYLLGAIAKNHGRVELEEYGGSVDEPSGSPLHRVLIDPAYHEDCGPPAAVWDYVEVMGKNEKDDDPCACDGRGWLHLGKYQCEGRARPYVQRCDGCGMLSSDVAAVMKHALDCDVCRDFKTTARSNKDGK